MGNNLRDNSTVLITHTNMFKYLKVTKIKCQVILWRWLQLYCHFSYVQNKNKVEQVTCTQYIYKSLLVYNAEADFSTNIKNPRNNVY